DELYEAKGLASTPIVSRTKKPAVDEWPRLTLLAPEDRRLLRQTHGAAGIGLLAGTTLRSGCLLAFLDIDHEGFVRFVIAVLGGLLSGKKGEKGLTIFVQAEQGMVSIK